jgi:regulator of sirC expression with transglutaminase-like and TPR domain
LVASRPERKNSVSHALAFARSDGPPRPRGKPPADTAAAVAAVLDRPDRGLDYFEAKLAFDAVVDPSLDADAARAEVARLTGEARRLAGPAADDAGRVAALRTILYQAGPWNGHRPFAYDPGDPEGLRIANKLLPNYLSRRLGQCVSMPILFLILAERLGLDVALAHAPSHIFVRHRLPDGRTANLETTSGGHPAREDWIRASFPMSDRAIASGLYLRSLGRREAVVAMAGTILEHLADRGLLEESEATAALLLRHSPRDLHAMLSLATAQARMLERDFHAQYASPFLIPAPLRPRHALLAHSNRILFAAAEALGWEEPR